MQRKCAKNTTEENRCEIGMSNDDDEKEANDACDSRSDKATKKNERTKRKEDKMKVKGKVEDEKEEGVVRLFSANFNGFGPCSESKIDQTKETSKLRNMDGLMASSSDVRWNVRNEMKTIMSNNVAMSASDSGEEVDDRTCFLKEALQQHCGVTYQVVLKWIACASRKMDGGMQ